MSAGRSLHQDIDLLQRKLKIDEENYFLALRQKQKFKEMSNQLQILRRLESHLLTASERHKPSVQEWIQFQVKRMSDYSTLPIVDVPDEEIATLQLRYRVSQIALSVAQEPVMPAAVSWSEWLFGLFSDSETRQSEHSSLPQAPPQLVTIEQKKVH